MPQSSSSVAERSTTPGLPSVPPPPTARGRFLRQQKARLEEEAAVHQMLQSGLPTRCSMLSPEIPPAEDHPGGTRGLI